MLVFHTPIPMRNIGRLSALISVSTLSFGLVAASNPMPESISESAANGQSQPSLTVSVFPDLGDVLDTADDVLNVDSPGDVIDVIYTVDQLIQAENRRKEIEEARAAATEQERLEAERRQQYFESLSPEEQQAYIEEQQALQAQQDQTATMFMLLMFSAAMSGGSGSGQQDGGGYVTCSDGHGYYQVYVGPGEAPPHSGCS